MNAGCTAHQAEILTQHPRVLSELCHPSAELMVGTGQVFPLQSKLLALGTWLVLAGGKQGKVYDQHQAVQKTLEGEEKGKTQLQSLVMQQRDVEVVSFGTFVQERRMMKARDGWTRR